MGASSLHLCGGIDPVAGSSRFERRCDGVVECLLAALLCFAPLAFGATEAWSEQVVIALAAGMAAALALKLLVRPAGRVTWSWAYLPALLFLALIVVQLLPLPARALGWISPNTHAVRAELLADLPGQPASAAPLSFYLPATYHDLRLLLAITAIFVVVANVYRSAPQVTRLLKLVAVIGLAVATIALYQNLAGAQTIYGLVSAGHVNSGPFMNHSHFGQFMNLSIGAMLGLLLMGLDESSRPYCRDGARSTYHAGPPWLWACGIVLAAATVLMSLTRGGAISMLVAGAATGAVLARRRQTRGRGAMVVVLGIAIFGGLLYAGFDTVYQRLATLRNVADDNGNRAEVLRDLWALSARFPLAGTGLGTHEFVFPMFDRSAAAGLSTHAENEYAQLLEETGWAGAALCLAFMAMIAFHYVRCVWRPRQRIHLAAFGLGFGLLAIVVHSLSDFGQHVPANAALTAVSTGLLVSLSQFGRHLAAASSRQARPRRVVVATRAVAAAATVCVAFVCLAAADRSRRAEAAWTRAAEVEAQLDDKGWDQGSDEDYAALIGEAGEAVALAPGDVTYRFWLNVYRWRSISRAADPTAEPLELTSDEVEFAERVVSELHESRALCPTFGRIHSFAGQLERFALMRPEGGRHIRTGYRLAGYDPGACFAAAALEAEEKRWDDSVRAARRAAQLDRLLAPAVSELYLRLERPDLAHAAAAGDHSALASLADRLESLAGQEALVARCRAEALSLAQAAADRPDARAATLAELADLYARQGTDASAIDYYRRALTLDYGHVDWRLRLARLLDKIGHYEEAVREARICLRLRPDMRDAQALITSIRDRQTAAR